MKNCDDWTPLYALSSICRAPNHALRDNPERGTPGVSDKELLSASAPFLPVSLHIRSVRIPRLALDGGLDSP